jgi:hypothetical protein
LNRDEPGVIMTKIRDMRPGAGPPGLMDTVPSGAGWPGLALVQAAGAS